MSYSITVEFGKPNQNGTSKVYLLVIYNREKLRVPTDMRIPPASWVDGKITGLPNNKHLNLLLKSKINATESLLLEELAKNKTVTKERLSAILLSNKSNSGLLEDAALNMIESLAGEISEARLRHYRCDVRALCEYKPKLKCVDVNSTLLGNYEKHLRKLGKDVNTVWSRMQRLHSLLNKMAKNGDIDGKQVEDYKVPRYEQKVPEYLTEQEMADFAEVVRGIKMESVKLAGYYFLLGCYAGYRIGDLKQFDYDKMVKDGNIIVRAKKNGAIVSMPIHTRLADVLSFVKDKPLMMAEETMRKYVKDIARMAGIVRKVKVHTARHSFAMMLMKNGFTQEEAAELLGDTVEVARIYARISNENLSRKIRERLG